MTSLTFVLLSGTISFGVPVAVAVRELLTLPAFGRGGDEPPPRRDVPPVPRPLPVCLLPATIMAREAARSTRVLEDA